MKKAGHPGLNGQNALSLVDLEPSNEEGHAMSPAILAEGPPFKQEHVHSGNATIAVSVCNVKLLSL